LNFSDCSAYIVNSTFGQTTIYIRYLFAFFAVAPLLPLVALGSLGFCFLLFDEGGFGVVFSAPVSWNALIVPISLKEQLVGISVRSVKSVRLQLSDRNKLVKLLVILCENIHS